MRIRIEAMLVFAVAVAVASSAVPLIVAADALKAPPGYVDAFSTRDVPGFSQRPKLLSPPAELSEEALEQIRKENEEREEGEPPLAITARGQDLPPLQSSQDDLMLFLQGVTEIELHEARSDIPMELGEDLVQSAARMRDDLVVLADHGWQMGVAAMAFLVRKELVEAQASACSYYARTRDTLATLYRKGECALQSGKADSWFTYMHDASQAGSERASRDVTAVLLREDPPAYAEALPYLERLAEAGSADALLLLGWMRQTGTGVERDPIGAIHAYAGAGELGSALAMVALADLLLEGDGAERNRAEALAHYERAADLGNKDAVFAAARLYADVAAPDYDVCRDLTWSVRAYVAGQESYKERVKKIAQEHPECARGGVGEPGPDQ